MKKKLPKLDIKIEQGDVGIETISPLKLSKDLIWLNISTKYKWPKLEVNGREYPGNLNMWAFSGPVEENFTKIYLKVRGNWYIQALPKKYGIDLILIRQPNSYPKNKKFYWDFETNE